MKIKEQKITEKIEKLVVDTSVLIEGLLSQKITDKEINPKEILIHNAVIAELEYQANTGREIGHLGFDEIKELRALTSKYNFKIVYGGERPKEFEIRHAKAGEIDAAIREWAFEENCHFITADRVNSRAAEAKGIKTILIEFEKPEDYAKMAFEKYFDETTMSIHIKEDTEPVAKRGKPGEWGLEAVDKVLDRKEVENIAKEIVEEATRRKDGFIEIQRKGSTIIQLGKYRTVITKPPFADGWEITIVRPVKKLNLEDYALSDKLKSRLRGKAEGILIAGAPGMGKSTFTQALTGYYAEQNKIIKTVEAPRDLVVPKKVTQYALAQGTNEEIRDILLLSRPDYTIFDEMRNQTDFELFADLRLSGVGMVGIVHATKPVDAIQRFLGKIEMGIIPHVVDTVIFIQNGGVAKTFSLKMEVKVPHGMTEGDLARPVVVIKDFESDKQEYEIYSFGDATIVVPVTETAKGKEDPIKELAKLTIEQELQRYADDIEVEINSPYKCTVYVPEQDIASIIGKQGKNIMLLEKMLGISIDVQELKGKTKGKAGTVVPFKTETTSGNIILKVDSHHAGKSASIYIKGEQLVTANIGKKGEIRIKKDNKLGKTLKKAISYEDQVEVRVI